MSSGGFFYRLEVKLIFTNPGVTKAYVLSKTRGCIKYYASHSQQIFGVVPRGYRCDKVNATNIMSSCKITQSQLSVYYATMKKVLVLRCGCKSAANIDRKLKSLGNIVNTFLDLYIFKYLS